MYCKGIEPCLGQMDWRWNCQAIYCVPATNRGRKEKSFVCRIHNYVKHSTKDCWTLCRLFHKKLREETLELTQKEPEVQRNPLPNHKGKGVVAVVIYENPS